MRNAAVNSFRSTVYNGVQPPFSAFGESIPYQRGKGKGLDGEGEAWYH